MSKPTIEQLAEMHEQIKAGRITRENLQAFPRDPNSVFSSILSIDRSCPFNPAEFIGKEFIGKEWSIIEQDERSFTLTEVNINKICLVTMLNDGETRVQGNEKLRRLRVAGYICLDAKVFLSFWENKERIPDSWKGKFVYFDGTVLQSPDGRRCVLYLYWCGSRWFWFYRWLKRDCSVDYPSAVLAE